MAVAELGGASEKDGGAEQGDDGEQRVWQGEDEQMGGSGFLGRRVDGQAIGYGWRFGRWVGFNQIDKAFVPDIVTKARYVTIAKKFTGSKLIFAIYSKMSIR